MSSDASGAIWKSGLYEGARLLVALKLADYANDDGDAWPSRARLALMCGIDERTVKRDTAQMVTDGVLTKVAGGGRGRRNRYELHLDRLRAIGACWVAMQEAARDEEIRFTRYRDVKTMVLSPLFGRINGDSRPRFWELMGGVESLFDLQKGDICDQKGDSVSGNGDSGVPQNPSGILQNESRARMSREQFQAIRAGLAERGVDPGHRMRREPTRGLAVLNDETLHVLLRHRDWLGEQGVEAIFVEHGSKEVRL